MVRPVCFAFALGQSDHFVQGRDLKQAVVLLIAIGAGLNGVQGFDFRQGKIAGEPVVVFDAVDHALGFTVGKFRMAGDVGGAAYHRFVTGDHMAVLGQHQIGLDKIGAHFDSQSVAFQCVFGAIAGSAAVTDDDWGLSSYSSLCSVCGSAFALF